MTLRPVLFVLSAAAIIGCHSNQRALTRIPFIEDDYRVALAEAKSRNVPLFVEVWAPW